MKSFFFIYTSSMCSVFHCLVSLCSILYAIHGNNATTVTGTLSEFLFGNEKQNHSYISETLRLAEKERDQIESLLNQELGSVVLFLPTNEAWVEKPGWIEALLKDDADIVRHEAILASIFNTIDQNLSTWESLRNFAELTGGVLSNVYGTPYLLKDRIPETQSSICLAEWRSGVYREGDCAEFIFPPIVLSDAVIYPINKALLRKELEDEIKLLLNE